MTHIFYTRSNNYYIWQWNGKWIITKDSPASALLTPNRLAFCTKYSTMEAAVKTAQKMLPNG